MQKKIKDYIEYKEKFRKLVELERKEEMKFHKKEMEQLSPGQREAKGRALLDMKGKSQGRALEGFMIKFSRGEKLPGTEIGAGDLIMASKKDPLNPDNPTGTVCEMTNYSVTVAFNDRPPEFVTGRGVRLDLYVNDITFQRMLEAISSLQNKEKWKKILLGKTALALNSLPEITKIKDKKLNKYQLRAVKKSMAAKDLFLIHGPPGTGKTTTLIEIIRQHVKKGNKVLASAASNVAVDNLVEFLDKRGIKAVRIGHPARVTESLKKHTLDYRVGKRQKYRKAQKIRERVYKLKDKQKKKTFPSGKWRRGLSNEAIRELAEKGTGKRGISPDKMKSMSAWLKIQDKINGKMDKVTDLEDEAIEEVISTARVVCSTNSTAGSRRMSGRDFDVCLIDEATQATEPATLIPLLHAPKVIMAGDSKQLPPTILNQKAKEGGLEKTMFERLAQLYPENIKQLLGIQYRMNREIMEFSNKKFYGGRLKADSRVAGHVLKKIKDTDHLLQKICTPEKPVIFIDLPGKSREIIPPGSTSKMNKKEARYIYKIIKYLTDSGFKTENIGVISPYDAQIDLLTGKNPKNDLEISTVDGFQGREKKIIILSLVRSNKRGNLGFLTDMRRLNVSLTRARKKLIILGDSTTLSKDKNYRDLIEYVKRKSGYIKISED
ncbi:MAG: IGHMBP2 family helicase [Elusimicrobiota bacterium]